MACYITSLYLLIWQVFFIQTHLQTSNNTKHTQTFNDSLPRKQVLTVTHTPMLRTFAGGTFPAAVICPVKKRPKLLAASTTALYLKLQSTTQDMIVNLSDVWPVFFMCLNMSSSDIPGCLYLNYTACC